MPRTRRVLRPLNPPPVRRPFVNTGPPAEQATPAQGPKDTRLEAAEQLLGQPANLPSLEQMLSHATVRKL